MNLGEVIKKYRYDHGKMSMQTFADKCGLSKGYIAMLERNINSKTGEPVTPSVETFIKVAAAMNMNLNELTNIVDENQPVALTSDNFPKGSMLYHTVLDNNCQEIENKTWGTDDTKKEWEPKLTAKDERDIRKDLDDILNSLDSDTGLMFDGEAIDDETKELLAASLEHAIRTAKITAKKKFTPKKYRKD